MSIFVTYTFQEKDAYGGSGRCEVYLDAPQNMDDVEKIEAAIKTLPNHVNHPNRIISVKSWQEWAKPVVPSSWEEAIKNWNAGYGGFDTSSPSVFLKELEEYIDQNMDGG